MLTQDGRNARFVKVGRAAQKELDKAKAGGTTADIGKDDHPAMKIPAGAEKPKPATTATGREPRTPWTRSTAKR